MNINIDIKNKFGPSVFATILFFSDNFSKVDELLQTFREKYSLAHSINLI